MLENVSIKPDKEVSPDHLTYENALVILNIPKLSVRRKDLCLKFALKASKNNKYSAWFQETIKISKNCSQEKHL